MSSYQIVVSFNADNDAHAIKVMEHLDETLPDIELPITDVSTSMPKRHVPARWESVSYASASRSEEGSAEPE